MRAFVRIDLHEVVFLAGANLRVKMTISPCASKSHGTLMKEAVEDPLP